MPRSHRDESPELAEAAVSPQSQGCTPVAATGVQPTAGPTSNSATPATAKPGRRARLAPSLGFLAHGLVVRVRGYALMRYRRWSHSGIGRPGRAATRLPDALLPPFELPRDRPEGVSSSRSNRPYGGRLNAARSVPTTAVPQRPEVRRRCPRRGSERQRAPRRSDATEPSVRVTSRSGTTD